MQPSPVTTTVSRRSFIFTAASAAGGLLVGIGAVPGSAGAATVSTQPWTDHEYPPYELDAWVAIDPDDSILIRYQRSEMGRAA